MVSNIQKMIEYLDRYLIQNKMTYIHAPEANVILEEAGLLKDNKSKHGKPLRDLLRKGYFPHAYKDKSTWIIPFSKDNKLNTKEKEEFVYEINNENHQTELLENIRKERLKYKPKKIKYLIIAQASPEDVERFFYYHNVRNKDYLFLGIAGVLYPDLKEKYIEGGRNESIKANILSRFQEDGFYLIDLSELPLSYMVGNLSAQLPSLIERIRKLVESDTKIILIKADVYDIAFSSLNNQFNNVINVRIHFPCCGNQNKFRENFLKALELSNYMKHRY